MGTGRRFFGDLAARWLTALAGASIIAILSILLGIISYNGRERLSWEFLTAASSEGMTGGGVFPAIFGTAALVVILTLFVASAGVFVAIYFSEYANRSS